MAEWISVKDRLPEDRHSVLVYCPHNKCIYTAYYDDFNDEWYYFGCGGGIEVYYTVTHWMPLPEQPEEVERYAKSEKEGRLLVRHAETM